MTPNAAADLESDRVPSAAPRTHSLDIAVPVYNEGENISTLLAALGAHVKVPYRVLICYDGDDDNTLDTVRAYCRACGHKVPEIVFVKNRGRGPHSAVVTGFAASTAPAVLVMPADDVDNAAIVDEMFSRFEAGAEIVAASRFMRGGVMQGCPWLKAVLVRSAAFSMYHLARLPIHDPTNGLRLFSRRILESIVIESSGGFTYSIELTVKCHRLGWKIDEVPSRWIERQHGTTRFKVVQWIPAYLEWYGYAFATTYLRRGPATVPHKDGGLSGVDRKGAASCSLESRPR